MPLPCTTLVLPDRSRKKEKRYTKIPNHRTPYIDLQSRKKKIVPTKFNTIQTEYFILSKYFCCDFFFFYSYIQFYKSRYIKVYSII